MQFLIALTLLFSLIGCGGFQDRPEVPPKEFLYWCVQEGKWPVYEAVPAHCKEVSQGQWDHYPISVNAEPALVSETLEAVHGFNAQLGFNLFVYEPLNTQPDVSVIVDGVHPFAAAMAENGLRNKRRYGRVRVFNGVENFDLPNVMMHELGHIVGLRHDNDNRLSLMYGGPESKVASLERQDVVALRRIYLE